MNQIKLSPKQTYSIKNSIKPINIWHGSTRAGKTFASLLRFLIYMQKAPEGDMVVLARDANAFRRNVLPMLQNMIGKDCQYLHGMSLMKIWGRNIHVIGAHDSRAEGKLRGPTFVGAYVDEANQIPYSAWVILMQRCAMGKHPIFATTNPDSPFHWLKKEVIDNNPDVAAFHFTMLDNPQLSPEDRAYLERQHVGIYYKRFVLGEWCLAEGAVFEFFDERIHVIKRAPAFAKSYYVGVDIGFTNPTAFVMLGYNPDVSPCYWVEKEYYWDHKKMSRSKTDAEFADDLYDFIEGYNVDFVYIDPAAASFKNELRRSGVGAPIKDAENDVSNGIQSLCSAIHSGDLKIKKDCVNLIGEIQSYSWDPKKSEKGEDEPIKKMDHAVDALRYAYYSQFGKRLMHKGDANDFKPLASRNPNWSPSERTRRAY